VLSLLLSVCDISAQVITFGPTSPAANAEVVHTCFDSSQFSVTFSNSSTALSDATVEVQLNAGIEYVPGSFSYTTNLWAGLFEGDMSNLNRPKFIIGALAPGEIITLNIGRQGTCQARDLKINGNTFRDSTFVFESGVEVNYSNGISQGTATYDLVYAALSITNVVTNPSPANIVGLVNRSAEITNGSFGSVDTFTYCEILPAGTLGYSDFRINPAGTNYSIPSSNIEQSGDTLFVKFSATEIMAIDGLGGSVGDGDGNFEIDEQFVLNYKIQALSCGVANILNSDLSVHWGCGEEICQTGSNTATLPIVTATPTLSTSNTIKNTLDFCQAATYSTTITNTSSETTPAGGSFAKDVVVFLGMRANESPIATLANVSMWSPTRLNTKIFSDYTLNGIPVTLPTIDGVYDLPVSYLPPDYFMVDPDGVGGLEDLDGDGYFDDLAMDSTIDVSFQVNIAPVDRDSGLGRADYMYWEHISADINWSNQCGVLMSPIRQEFNYTNFIRDYNNSTLLDAPSDVSDALDFTASIKPHLYQGINCNGASGAIGPDVDWTVRAILPPGIIVDPSYDASKFTVVGDTIFTSGAYSFAYTDFPLRADCSSWNNVNPMQLTFETVYECNSGGSNCFSQVMHAANVPIFQHCGSSCSGVSTQLFSALRTSGSWEDNTQSTLVDIEDPGIEREIVYPYDTVMFSARGVYADTMSENLYLRVDYSLEDGFNIFDYVSGEIHIMDIDGQYNGGTVNYNTPLTAAPTVNHLGGQDYEMIFDLSSYRTEVDAAYKYGQSASGPPSYDQDTIVIEALFVVNESFNAIYGKTVNGFRSEFYVMDNGVEKSCSSWGANLAYNKTQQYLSGTTRYTEGCNSFYQNFYFTHQSYTGDDHPNEYRPPTHFDSAIIELPKGYDVGDIRFLDASVMDPSDYSLNGTELRVFRPAGYADFDKRQTFYPNLAVQLIPSCEVVEGATDFEMTLFYKNYAYQSNVANHVSSTAVLSRGNVTYTAPEFDMTPHEVSKEIYEDQVS